MKKENWKKIKTKELNNFTFHKWWEEGEKEVRKFTERIIGQARQEIIEKIDKIYKKEQGIHNWLDLREKLKEEIKKEL